MKKQFLVASLLDVYYMNRYLLYKGIIKGIIVK